MAYRTATLDVAELATAAAGSDSPDEAIERALAKLDVYPADRWKLYRKAADRVMDAASGLELAPGPLVVRYRTNKEEIEMPDTEKVREFVGALLEDEPGMDNADVNRHVNKRFAADMSRQQTSAIARFVRKDLEARPATNGNGAKPEAQGSEDNSGAEPAPDAVPGGDDARDRLRTYARAFSRFAVVADAPEDDPLRKQVRGQLVDLEEQLIAELTANANHADVEKRAFDLYDRIDQLRQDAEELTSALSRATTT